MAYDEGASADRAIGCVVCRQRQPYTGYVCGPCVIREMRRLSEIVNLYALLPSALDAHPDAVIDLTYPPVGGAAATVVVHADPRWHDQHGPIPVAARLDSWVRDWTETLGYTDPPKVPTVSRLANWLQIWLAQACRDHQAIDEYAREIRELAAQMRRAINRDLTPVRYEAPCPYCGTKTLRREAGGDWIECGGRDGCGRLWGEDEYGLLARAAIPDDELLTTIEAATIAEVEPHLIRKWDQRGKLVPASRDHLDRPLYHAGEVRRIAFGVAVVA